MNVDSSDPRSCLTKVFRVGGILQRKNTNNSIHRRKILLVKIVWKRKVQKYILSDKSYKNAKKLSIYSLFCCCSIVLTIFNFFLWLLSVLFSHVPNPAANRSLYAVFQHRLVISRFFAFSKAKFHSGKRVPSVSRNSSDASSQNRKS